MFVNVYLAYIKIIMIVFPYFSFFILQTKVESLTREEINRLTIAMIKRTPGLYEDFLKQFLRPPPPVPQVLDIVHHNLEDHEYAYAMRRTELESTGNILGRGCTDVLYSHICTWGIRNSYLSPWT